MERLLGGISAPMGDESSITEHLLAMHDELSAARRKLVREAESLGLYEAPEFLRGQKDKT